MKVNCQFHVRADLPTFHNELNSKSCETETQSGGCEKDSSYSVRFSRQCMTFESKRFEILLSYVQCASLNGGDTF
jgi:hypothetical protein